jgi:hypothetical protein
VVGQLHADLSLGVPAVAGQWWATLRPHMAVLSVQDVKEFVLDVMLAGPGFTGTRLAGMAKSLLDGLVCCFHVHDASMQAEL